MKIQVKITKEYSLPDDDIEFQIDSKGSSYYYCILIDVQQRIRSALKYPNDTDTIESVLEDIRSLIPELPY